MRPIYDLNVAMSVTLSSQSTPVLSNYKEYQSRIVTACLMGHMESKIPPDWGHRSDGNLSNFPSKKEIVFTVVTIRQKIHMIWINSQKGKKKDRAIK